ncbi:hypothetical protein PanWU01x14_318570 [Parasponia andersonii]|uniref:Uncharacterized protein n=1 Tax=Parasponia andersonii TaxID=3476 RepID=A0A2P5AM69_PARAD|nr:hypothetical protein PanWU01x14_318570 [Parasponia andersonii]
MGADCTRADEFHLDGCRLQSEKKKGYSSQQNLNEISRRLLSVVINGGTTTAPVKRHGLIAYNGAVINKEQPRHLPDVVNRPYKLAVGSRDNIVYLRYVQESTSSTIIHGRELGAHNFRVSIEVVLDAIALISILNPDDDTRLVDDALGSHLAAPKMLVIFEDNLEFNDINRHQTGKNKSSQSQLPQTQERVHPQRKKVESIPRRLQSAVEHAFHSACKAPW